MYHKNNKECPHFTLIIHEGIGERFSEKSFVAKTSASNQTELSPSWRNICLLKRPPCLSIKGEGVVYDNKRHHQHEKHHRLS